MEIKIIKQEKNPFLQREEIILEIKSDATPSSAEIKKQIGKDENLTIVKNIKGTFGTQIFTAEVFVYNSEKEKNQIETIPKKLRKKLQEEKKEKAEEKKSEQAEQEKAKNQQEEKQKEEKNQENNKQDEKDAASNTKSETKTSEPRCAKGT